MLRVVLKNGDVREYSFDEFTDYDWRPEVFIVLKGNQWIAMFNWSEVREVNYLDV